MSLPDYRLTRKVFNWDKANGHPWTKDVHEISYKVNSQISFQNNLQFKIPIIKETFDIYKKQWELEVLKKPKLRIYVQFKVCFSTEPYVNCNMKRRQRSLCAQLRAGVLPLEVEVGRYKGVPEEDRLCAVCDLSLVEDEFHFMFYCPLYNDLRNVLFEKIQCKNPDLFRLSEGDMLGWLFSNDWFSVATFVEKAWTLRQRTLYPKM